MPEWLARAAVAAALISTPAFSEEVKIDDLVVAMTIPAAQQNATVKYINEQARHHSKRSFEDEFLAFLKKHSIEYDPKYVWG